MAVDAHKNFAYSTVATAPSPATSGTSLVVASGEGTRFPAVPFNATVWPLNAIPTPANSEIVRVTARSTDTLTITRAQESTTARSVIVGDQIAATITVKTLTDVEATTGTWTPVIGGSTSESGQTYTSQVGRWERIGNRVRGQGYVALSVKGTITGSVVIKGLPVASLNVTNAYAAVLVSYFSGMNTNWIALSGYIEPNVSVIQLLGLQAAAAATGTVAATDISNSTALVISFDYEAA